MEFVEIRPTRPEKFVLIFDVSWCLRLEGDYHDSGGA